MALYSISGPQSQGLIQVGVINYLPYLTMTRCCWGSTAFLKGRTADFPTLPDQGFELEIFLSKRSEPLGPGQKQCTTVHIEQDAISDTNLVVTVVMVGLEEIRCNLAYVNRVDEGREKGKEENIFCVIFYYYNHVALGHYRLHNSKHGSVNRR